MKWFVAGLLRLAAPLFAFEKITRDKQVKRQYREQANSVDAFDMAALMDEAYEVCADAEDRAWDGEVLPLPKERV